MNDSMQHAASDVLDYLLTLQRDHVRPREARARLQPLRERYPDLNIDLLVEEQVIDQTVHYDALLRRVGEGTVSMSYCPERAVPWPLRGVHRWSEGDLVRVNANVLQVDQAMACLDFIWDEAPIIERLVNMCLVQEELDREPIILSDIELQEAMDKFRTAKKLFRAEDTLRWLERHGMSHEKLERFVSDNAILVKLRDRIVGDQIEDYFRQHPGDFDTATIARLKVADESQSRELAEQIRSGRQDFFAAAQRRYCEAVERGEASQPDLFAVVERHQTEPALRDPLFAATTGQLVGPVPVDAGFELIRVLAIQSANLEDRTRTAIKEILFANWLAECRQAARIEWSWGNASKTG